MQQATTKVRRRIVNRPPAPAAPTLSEAITQYLAQRDPSGVRPHTVNCERSQLKKLLELLSDKPVDQISIRDVEVAVDTRRAEGLASNSLNHMGRMAKRYFKWLEAAGLTEGNSIAGQRVIKVDQAKIVPMTQEQVGRLLGSGTPCVGLL